MSDGRFCFGVGVGWLREEIANHGVDPSVRGRVVDERLRAMITIWTEGSRISRRIRRFQPHIQLAEARDQGRIRRCHLGGRGGISAHRQLGAGWMSLSISGGGIEVSSKLRDLAGREVPVISCHVGDLGDAVAATANGIEHLTVELPTGTRDQTRRRLDELWTVFSKLD